MRRPERILVAIALLAVLVGAGCGGGSGEKGSKDKAAREAPSGGKREGEIDRSKRLKSLTTEVPEGEDGGVDYDAYAEDTVAILGTLEAFWETTFDEELGEKFVPPREYIAYYPEEDDPGCDGEAAGEFNAVYCGDGEFIAWDEPNLMLPFYSEKGPMAEGFVLGHEYGHAVQDSLGISEDFSFTIESELQADCFSGAWAGTLADEGILDPEDEPGAGGDIDSALDAIYTVADDAEGNPGPWQEPDAHGTGDERATAFADGYDGGVEVCANDYAPGFAEEPGSEIAPKDSGGGDALGVGG